MEDTVANPQSPSLKPRDNWLVAVYSIILLVTVFVAFLYLPLLHKPKHLSATIALQVLFQSYFMHMEDVCVANI